PMIAVNRARGNSAVIPSSARTSASPDPYTLTASTARAATRASDSGATLISQDLPHVGHGRPHEATRRAARVGHSFRRPSSRSRVAPALGQDLPEAEAGAGPQDGARVHPARGPDEEDGAGEHQRDRE